MLWVLFSIAFFVMAWVTLSGYVYRTIPSRDEVHYVTTADGWRIALVRFRPDKPSKNLPIVMSHGLGANHTGFDIRPGNSYARWLADLGFDVWVLEIRGSGFSEKPQLFGGRSYDWEFDEFIVYDGPAAVEYICQHTGCEKVHWVGHSMGGILVYGMLAREHAHRIQSAVISGSSLNYSASDSDFHSYLKLTWVRHFLPAVPAGFAAKLLAPLMGRVPIPTDKFNWWPDNMDPVDCRLMSGTTLDAISTGALIQLTTAFEPTGFRTTDGSLNYFEAIKDVKTPVLALAADEDRQCPPVAARATFDQLGSDDKELLVFGPEYGHAGHYGHIDMIAGRRCQDEVYPHIQAWLERQDAAAG